MILHGWPDAYRGVLAVLDWDNVHARHESQATEYTERKKKKSLSALDTKSTWHFKTKIPNSNLSSLLQVG